MNSRTDFLVRSWVESQQQQQQKFISTTVEKNLQVRI